MANQTKYFKTPFAESGTRSEVPNNSVGGAVGFDTGFGPDYELPQGSAGRKRIERDKYNGLHHSITKNLKQWQENVYPTWIEDAGAGVPFSYPQGMIVNHAGFNWVSNEAANQEEPGAGFKWYKQIDFIVRLSEITGIQAGDTSDNGLKVQQAMEHCAANNLHLVMDVTTYVDCTRTLQVTPTRQRMGGILVPDHLRCTFLSKVEIRSLTNSEQGANVLVFAGRKDIKMFYPHVVGDRETHTGSLGEWGHGYEMAGAIGDILLFQPKARQTWGDGFYIGLDFSDPLTATPNNIELFKPRTYKASRNGISWTGGIGISIIRPRNESVDRIAPMCGIDIEPEHATISDMQISGVIESPVSVNCGSSGLFTFINKGVVDIDITGTLVDTGSLRAWTHKVYLPSPSLTGALRINRIASHNAKLEAALIENLKGHVKVSVKTLDIYDCLSDTSSDPSIVKASVGLQTTFGASTPTVDAVFADVQISNLNVYDSRPTKLTEYPVRTSRFHAQVTYMENVHVNVVDNETTKGYILTGYGIRNSCKFRVTATFENPASWPSGVLASTMKINSLSSSLILVLNSSAVANGEGVRVEKLGGVGALTVKVPSDGTTLTNANVNVTASGMTTSWAAARLDIAQISTFSYGVVNNYGFAP